MPVGEMLVRTSALELAEWQAYEREYGPLGPERGDWQAALVAHTFAMLMSSKKGRKLKLQDFLLRWSGGRSSRQSSEQILALFRGLAARQESLTRNQEKI